MKRKIWQVWTEKDIPINFGMINGDRTLFEGSEKAARKYYKDHGGMRSGLHLGYLIPEDDLREKKRK